MARVACDDFWRDVSSTRLSQLGGVGIYPTVTTRSRTIITNKEEHLQSTLAALRDQRDGEVDAIRLAKEAVEDHYWKKERAIITAIASLRSQSNELAPVSRLPPEILTLVFTSLSDTNTPRFPRQPYRYEPRKASWIVVTHVCRRWRQTALEQRSLWARIQIPMGKTWARAFLERAGPLPLSIAQHQSSSKPWIADLVKKNLPRVKELKLCIVHAHPSAVHALQISAPMLESLDVQFADSDVGPVHHDLDTPRLRHFCLVGWHFPWTSPALNDLVTLDLGYPDPYLTRADHLVPLATIISALKNVRKLVQLAVHLVLPERDATPTDLFAELPSLTSLFVTGTMGDIVMFFRHLTFSPNAEVSLKIQNQALYTLEDNVGDGDDISTDEELSSSEDIFSSSSSADGDDSSSSSASPSPSSTPVSASEDGDNNEGAADIVDDDDEKKTRIQTLAKFFETVLSLLRRQDNAPLWQVTKLLIIDHTGRWPPVQVHAWCGDTRRTSPNFSVQFGDSPVHWAQCKISEAAVHTLASERLEDLTINDPSFGLREWAMLEERIPGLKLRTVEVMGGAAVSLLHLLAQRSEHGAEDSGNLPPPSPFLPTLLSLTVRSMSAKMLPFSQRELPQLLAQRAAAGAPIKKVHIDPTCTIRMSTVRALQAACPEMAITGIDAGRWESSGFETEEDDISSDASVSDDD
ncbi:hypothetical protein FA95DRAFT_503959 [Auriscalpium vulgare]|uniref:Uncharacterized protein n=1 Tax=Auriscalpium vulgare TaxID=40419 RepID=A0ACB8RGE3_9AGAM|nr:hypothetical protein FA95DRAFT_503959 [Auriscalpium vulgare]